MTHAKPLVIAMLAASLPACASWRSTGVTDMSATEHEEAARQDRAAAREHANNFDPKAVRFVELYPEQPPGCDRSLTADCSPFWNLSKNPTDRELSEAAALSTQARKHRTAAKALRDTEARACQGVTPADRDISPFFHREYVRRVEEVGASGGRAPAGTAAGALVVFANMPGLTPQTLQRIVDCHLARNAELGYPQDENAFCPLNVRGAAASVRPVHDGLAVEVTSTDGGAALEIVKRIRALAPAEGPTSLRCCERASGEQR